MGGKQDVTMLSGQVLEFLERHPGAFTAQELWEYIPWNGRRILPCHVQQALEQRLFPMGLVAADKDVTVTRVKGRVKASPGTRWCALAQAPPGFLIHDPAEASANAIHGAEAEMRVKAE
jgi:hypothetical protein